MAQSIKAPDDFKAVIKTKKSVFLAGSIEEGKAVDWQTRVTKALAEFDVVVLNPRRDDWDSTWKQEIENKQFNEQVTWELSAQEGATVIAMYIDPETKSPITLLELGLFAKSGKVVLCCPDGFYRKGNVDIVAERYDVAQVETLDELIYVLKGIFDRFQAKS